MALQIDAKISNFQHALKNCSCFLITKFNLPSNNFKIVHRAHPRSPKVNQEIHAIEFSECNLVEFPRAENFLDLVENLTHLAVVSCNLTRITREDLRGLGCLKELYMGHNAIKQLPKGLFEFTPNLTVVSFWDNKIKEIHPNVLDPLRKLAFFNLMDNATISVKYDAMLGQGNVTLAQLKDEIEEKCFPARIFIAEMREEIEAVKVENCGLKKEVAALKNQLNNLSVKVELSSKAGNVNLKKISSDFNVKVNGKSFKVNKGILAANSPFLKKLFDENCGADCVDLQDVSIEAFEGILEFISTQKSPSNATNLIELFWASAKLEMKDLMDLIAEILMERVTSDNAAEIIKLCKKHGYEKLRKKAFNELKNISSEE